MTKVRLPSSEQMTAARLAGRFVCSCAVPLPRRLGVWSCSECSTCGRLVIEQDAAHELLDRLVDDGAVAAPGLRIARFPDGSELLVDDAAQTAAVRPHRSAVWGPPAELEEAP